MNAVFLSELSLSRKYNYQQTIIALVVSIAVAVGMSNIYCIVPIVAITISFSQAFTWIALDEQNGWERFRAAFPLTRAQIMLGRMSAIFVKLCIVVAFGVLLQFAMSALGPWMANSFHVDLVGYEFDAPYILLVVCMSFLLTSLLIGFAIPFAARFGMTRSMRYIPIGFAALVILGVCVMGMMPEEVVVTGFEAVLSVGIFWVSLIIALLSLGIFALSTAISVAFYKKRQF